jgi:ABC-type branched-subunit amino acid transport system substrate-binding protein
MAKEQGNMGGILGGVTRRRFGRIAGGAVIGGAVLGGPWIIKARGEEAVKLGGLFHMTGDGSIWGPMMQQCMGLAVEQINADGGVMGRQIEMISEDDATSTDVVVQKGTKLVQKDGVKAMFGVVYSSVRAALAANVAERYKVPYFYPTYWESQTSCGRYFISMGAIPNQQLDFFIPFLMEKFGPNFYCVGQDYNWPQVSIAYIEELLAQHGGKLVGKEFVPFDQSDWSSIIQRIKGAKPNVFFPFIGGNGLIACLKQYYDFGFDGTAVAATLMDEMYVPAFEPELRKGMHCSVSYLMELDNPVNKAFVAAFKKKYGADAILNNMGEGLYDSVHVWKLAVEKAGSFDIEKTVDALGGISYNAPQGEISIDGKSNHAALHQIIAEVRADGGFTVLKDFGKVAAKTSCSVG